MNIVKINPEEFGLTSETAKNIESQFLPMLQKMTELEAEFNEVVKLPIEDFDTSKKAKELRNKYVKVRRATAEIHKAQKQFYLNGGRFVDGWKNAQLFASQGKEEKLMEIETYAQRVEAERIRTLQEARLTEITPYIEDVDQISINFGLMEDDVWDAYFFKKKKDFEEMESAKKKAEEDRILEEKRIESERLQKEARRQKHIKREFEVRDYGRFFDWDSSHEETSDEDFQILIANAKKAKSEYDAEQEKIRLENERLKIEAQKRAKEEAKKQSEIDRLNAEIEAEKKRKEAEELAKKKEAEEKERIEKEAKKAPDIDKIKSAISKLSMPELDLSSKEMHVIYREITYKFESFKKWAKQKTA